MGAHLGSLPHHRLPPSRASSSSSSPFSWDDHRLRARLAADSGRVAAVGGCPGLGSKTPTPKGRHAGALDVGHGQPKSCAANLPGEPPPEKLHGEGIISGSCPGAAAPPLPAEKYGGPVAGGRGLCPEPEPAAAGAVGGPPSPATCTHEEGSAEVGVPEETGGGPASEVGVGTAEGKGSVGAGGD